MPNPPTPLTLQPLRSIDDLTTIATGQKVWVKSTHAGRDYYSPATITSVEEKTFTRPMREALSLRTPPKTLYSRYTIRVQPDSARGDFDHHVYPPGSFKQAYPDLKADDASRTRVLAAARDVTVTATPDSPHAFEGEREPTWGSDINARIFLPDVYDNEEAQAVIAAAIATIPGARVLRNQSRPIEDLRVHAFTYDIDGQQTPRAVNILKAEKSEIMRKHGSIVTTDVPYGTDSDIAIGQ